MVFFIASGGSPWWINEGQILTSGHLGGAKFVGTITEFEIFGRPLPNEELLKWTLCQNKGIFSFW